MVFINGSKKEGTVLTFSSLPRCDDRFHSARGWARGSFGGKGNSDHQHTNMKSPLGILLPFDQIFSFIVKDLEKDLILNCFFSICEKQFFFGEFLKSLISIV